MRYVDIPAIVQVIGSIYINPSLIDDDRYFFNEDDFTEEFHKIIFGSIYNMHQLGVKEITQITIEDYLESKPKMAAVYETYKGGEFLQKLSGITQPSAFDYYYNRMKKMTLFRMYKEKAGLDLSWLYDIDNILDLKKKQKQDEWFDNTSLSDMADIIDKKIDSIRSTYVEDKDNDFIGAGDDLLELLEHLKDAPEVGCSLYGKLMTTVTRGARLQKLYLRSLETGMGKTRSMIADICNLACSEIYDLKTNEWVANGTKEPSIFISTEQEEDEIQTMMLAFLSGVNEEKILTGKYENDDWDRVVHAAAILKNSPLYIKKLPDFSLQDIENTIKFGVREFNARYVAFDYIHSSMKILSEISSKAKVSGLREDNILFMIGVRLKDLCNEYGIFIMTATQVNASVKDGALDQTALRGAKSLGDKIDFGMLGLRLNDTDREKIKSIVENKGFPEPNLKYSIYKNRRGKYKDIFLWCKADLGICRIEPMFITDYRYNLLDAKVLNVITKEAESAF